MDRAPLGHRGPRRRRVRGDHRRHDRLPRQRQPHRRGAAGPHGRARLRRRPALGRLGAGAADRPGGRPTVRRGRGRGLLPPRVGCAGALQRHDGPGQGGTGGVHRAARRPRRPAGHRGRPPHPGAGGRPRPGRVPARTPPGRRRLRRHTGSARRHRPAGRHPPAPARPPRARARPQAARRRRHPPQHGRRRHRCAAGRGARHDRHPGCHVGRRRRPEEPGQAAGVVPTGGDGRPVHDLPRDDIPDRYDVVAARVGVRHHDGDPDHGVHDRRFDRRHVRASAVDLDGRYEPAPAAAEPHVGAPDAHDDEAAALVAPAHVDFDDSGHPASDDAAQLAARGHPVPDRLGCPRPHRHGDADRGAVRYGAATGVWGEAVRVWVSWPGRRTTARWSSRSSGWSCPSCCRCRWAWRPAGTGWGSWR
ncbi:hypothetical protein SBRY_11034 [Actinacidiphila bryophytorum]|uniref:Uncharacterized protein n=1 Tax=Actinacidiphila bryophytorum TaxID=1436133 RepID=A0A9W4E7A3_9ACTN|nr:hypothetical protein SBRY_11034 [Actinacidiphila bryophytorum]